MNPICRLIRWHMSRREGIENLSQLLVSMSQEGNIEATLGILWELNR